jgi:hypothetical protein
VKFPWLLRAIDPKTGKEIRWPALPVGFKRDGKYMSVNPTILVDTGADGTVLNLAHAVNFGFEADDLVEETYSTAGGQTTLWAPKNPSLLEIQIGTGWHPLPSLKFGRAPMSVLGRDVIFSRFELRMTPTEFEFIRLHR